jgi:predicted nucleic acid-binding protein
VTRLFLDANVLFTAAHNSNGKASLVLELAARGHWQVATSTYAADEARRNIARKLPWSRSSSFATSATKLQLRDPCGEVPAC